MNYFLPHILALTRISVEKSKLIWHCNGSGEIKGILLSFWLMIWQIFLVNGTKLKRYAEAEWKNSREERKQNEKPVPEVSLEIEQPTTASNPFYCYCFSLMGFFIFHAAYIFFAWTDVQSLKTLLKSESTIHFRLLWPEISLNARKAFVSSQQKKSLVAFSKDESFSRVNKKHFPFQRFFVNLIST